MGKCVSRIASPMPPGTSSCPASAKSVCTARIACTPLSEYSRPVYITGHAPPASAISRASSRIRSAGTPVMVSTASGRKCCT